MAEKQDAKKIAKAGSTAATAGAETKEDVYTVDEMIAESKAVFGLPRECAAAALKPLGIHKMTIKEATAAVDKYMKKGVK